MKYNKQYIGILMMISLVAPTATSALSMPNVNIPSLSNLNLNTSKNTPVNNSTPTVDIATINLNFCTNLSTYVTNADSKKSTQIKEKLANLDKRQAELLLKRTEIDRATASLEAKAVEKQTATYTKLLAQAKTDTEKAAINKYIAGTKVALAKRQASLTAARNTYRMSFDQVIAARKAKLEAALATEKATIDKAVAVAKTNCTQGKVGATVRTNLRNTIDQAHETFKATVKGIGKIDVATVSIETKRKAAVAAAEDTFTKEMEGLKVALKAEIGTK